MRPTGFARVIDRRCVVVITDETRVRISLRHDDGRSTVAAAHVRHACAGLELGLHAFERGNPATHQVGRIPGPEKTLGAGKQGGVLLVPTQARAAFKGLDQFGHRGKHGDGDLECARDEGRTSFHRKRQRLLLAQAELLRGRIVLGVTAGGLRRQPLQHVARVAAGFGGKHPGRHGVLGECLVEPEIGRAHV